MFGEIKVAAFSFVPKKMDFAGNARRMETCFRRAARRGAQLALAPEEILDGYPVTEVFEGRMSPQRMLDAAITIRDPYIRRFKALAAELKMSLAFGFAERINREIYNTAIFIDHRGRIRGRYHKMMLAEGYGPKQWYNRTGKHSRAIDTPFGKCGFMICNDRWNTDLARIPVLDGARFMLIPSYGDKSRAQDAAVLTVGRENGIPVLEANVGLLLLVDKGEIVARVKKDTAMIVGTMSIPVPPNRANRDEQERRFLARRRGELKRRYQHRLAGAKWAAPAVKTRKLKRMKKK